jgi:hypothetical protein
MQTRIEGEAGAAEGLGEAAEFEVALEQQHAAVRELGEQAGGGETADTRTDDDDIEV